MYLLFKLKVKAYHVQVAQISIILSLNNDVKK